MNTFYHCWNAPSSDLQLIVEDNGKVAYAYLLREKRIVGDVWLYNQAPTPDEPEWKDRGQMPFLNSSRYCTQPGDFKPLKSLDDISVDWLQDGAAIKIRGALFATVAVGQKPGSSKFAAHDGPLARVFIS